MTTNTPLYLDIHALVSAPPSNMNRDDSGSPKTARYGGAERLRLSSQSLKRATRMAFEKELPPIERSVRTRQMQRFFTTELLARGMSEEPATVFAEAAVGQLGIKADTKKGLLSYLLFLGEADRQKMSAAVSEVAAANPDADLKAAEKLLKPLKLNAMFQGGHSLGVGIFGRMVANHADFNVDASVQVAHALSTHAVTRDFDYYTAVDDDSLSDESGAGMIGTIEFASATFYKYATLGVHQLHENLGDQESAITGALTFAQHFATALPSGHQNSFAALTRPALVYVTLRKDRPVSYADAFECPIQNSQSKGYTDASIAALAKHVSAESERWGTPPAAAVASYAVSSGATNESDAAQLHTALGSSMPITDMWKSVEASLRELYA